MRRVALALVVIAALAPGPALAASPPPPTPVPVPCPSPAADSNGPQPTVCTTPSPFPTELHTPPPSLKPPPLEAKAAIVEDVATGQVLFTLHPNAARPLASTTKIMTALLTLQRVRPGAVVTIGPAAAAEGKSGAGFSELGLKLGEHITVKQLLYALMLQSSNDAAVALADYVSGSENAFVRAMNREARRLGLHRTVFFSPNGLDDRGHSTARAMAALTREAVRSPLIAGIVRTQFHDIPDPTGGARHIQNRNVLLWLYRGAVGVKTGYTAAAGYCLVATARRDGRSLVSVVLGDVSSERSFSDAAALLDYGFTAYRQAQLIQDGDDLSPVPVGTEQISVEAGAGLSRLLPTSAAEHVTRRMVVKRGLRLPIEPGGRIGAVSFRAGGHVVGTVPLVVTGRPSPRTAAPDRSREARPVWWLEGVQVAAGFGIGAFLSLFG
jgi:serine-type D-Ala-D-Ala carboxypeptidase (penicillin-binding protein 5/6)